MSFKLANMHLTSHNMLSDLSMTSHSSKSKKYIFICAWGIIICVFITSHVQSLLFTLHQTSLFFGGWGRDFVDIMAGKKGQYLSSHNTLLHTIEPLSLRQRQYNKNKMLTVQLSRRRGIRILLLKQPKHKEQANISVFFINPPLEL